MTVAMAITGTLEGEEEEQEEEEGVGRGSGIIPAKYLDYPIHTLSGGTRKKLSMLLADLGQPDALLLDECTTGVDPIAAERIVRYLKHLHLTATTTTSSNSNSNSTATTMNSSRCDSGFRNVSSSAGSSTVSSGLSASVPVVGGSSIDVGVVGVGVGVGDAVGAGGRDGQPPGRGRALLFASHRIDESIAVCGRVLMLAEGGLLYLDGSIDSFHALVHRFYQVDLILLLPAATAAVVVVPVAAGTTTGSSGFDAVNSVNDVSSDPEAEQLPQSRQQQQQQQHQEQEQEQDHGQATPLPQVQVPRHGYDGHILLPSTTSSTTSSSSMEHVIDSIAAEVGGFECIERIVVYSQSRLRITFEKRVVSISKIWQLLSTWKRKNKLLRKYSFRNMEMEEVLSTIIASSKQL